MNTFNRLSGQGDVLAHIEDSFRSGDFEMEEVARCPVCHSTNTTNGHLFDEYFEMMKARSGHFGRNAGIAQDAIADMLLARGITHIPNIFGAIPVRKGY